MKVKVATKSAKIHPLSVFAYCSMTGKFEGAFTSMEALRKAWPSAEIVSIEKKNGYTIVYC